MKKIPRFHGTTGILPITTLKITFHMLCKYGGADDHVSQVAMSFICYLVVATMTLQENKLYNNIIQLCDIIISY